MKKRILSFLLAFVMLIGVMPVGVFATETTEVTEETEATEETETTEATEATEASEPMEAATEPATEATEPTAESEGMEAEVLSESGDTEPAKTEAVSNVLSALEIAVGGNTIDTAAVQTLSPAFAGSTTEYSTPILDYESDKNNRFVWVKVSAPEGATVIAKCGGSEVAMLVSGQWGVLQVKGGYFWSPTYSGCLTPGEYNKVEITVSKEGETDKVYTVTVPMQPDIANRSLAWKTNLSDALYITKNDENAALTVEAQYKNRPLENEDVVTY